jgi:DNA-directed RNA polymerase specialized sigma24 family protein
MTAKDYLQLAYDLNDTIQRMVEQLDQLRADATRITSKLSDMPRCGGCCDKVGGAVARIVDLSKCIDKRIDKLADMREQIAEMISKIDDEQCRKLLRMRYIECMGFDEIAERMELSRNHVKNRLYEKSLAKIQHIVY